MRILYVGTLVHGGTCAMRLRALRELGNEVVAVDLTPPAALERARGIWPRVCSKLRLPKIAMMFGDT